MLAQANMRPRSGRVTSAWDDRGVEVVLRTETPEGIEVVLFAIVYAKIVEQHPAVADLAMIDRTIREPDERRPDPRPGRERFFRHETGVWVLAVVEFGELPAIIVTVFSADQPPS
jgi:hypothetical protein